MYISDNFVQNTYVIAERRFTETKEWISAHRAFVELAASFAFNYSLITFMARPIFIPDAIRHLLAGLAIQGGWNLYNYCMPTPLDTQPGEQAARLSAAYFVGQAGPQIAIHECGHAFAALCCFKNAHPEISIMPFKGGLTTYAISYGKTALGNWLGKKVALLTIAASGIIATTAVALLAFAIADLLKKKYPTFAAWLNYQGAAHILSDVFYGLGAFIYFPQKSSARFHLSLAIREYPSSYSHMPDVGAFISCQKGKDTSGLPLHPRR